MERVHGRHYNNIKAVLIESNNYCECKDIKSITTGFEDDFGYWDVCCECGKKMEDGHYYYDHYDG